MVVNTSPWKVGIESLGSSDGREKSRKAWCLTPRLRAWICYRYSVISRVWACHRTVRSMVRTSRIFYAGKAAKAPTRRSITITGRICRRFGVASGSCICRERSRISPSGQRKQGAIPRRSTSLWIRPCSSIWSRMLVRRRTSPHNIQRLWAAF